MTSTATFPFVETGIDMSADNTDVLVRTTMAFAAIAVFATLYVWVDSWEMKRAPSPEPTIIRPAAALRETGIRNLLPGSPLPAFMTETDWLRARILRVCMGEFPRQVRHRIGTIDGESVAFAEYRPDGPDGAFFSDARGAWRSPCGLAGAHWTSVLGRPTPCQAGWDEVEVYDAFNGWRAMGQVWPWGTFRREIWANLRIQGAVLRRSPRRY